MAEATQVALRNLYYAPLISDDASGAVYGAPVKMAQVIAAKIKPKTSSTVLYADDGAVEAATAVGETEVELETRNLPLSIQAALLGHTLAGGVLTKRVTDIAPYVAIGFEAGKSNGTKRYVWLFKGKFEIPEDDFKTKGDKVDFQTPKIKAMFLKRDFDDAYQKVADEEDPGYVPSVGANWYASVQGAPDTTAPTVTVVPAANATAIAVGSPVTWTFSEAIRAEGVNAANFAVIVDATGANVAGALSINAAKTIVTFIPAANLTAATPYRAIVTVGVKDIAGNALAAPSITKFTTA